LRPRSSIAPAPNIAPIVAAATEMISMFKRTSKLEAKIQTIHILAGNYILRTSQETNVNFSLKSALSS
jgi:hypothetical protein